MKSRVSEYHQEQNPALSRQRVYPAVRALDLNSKASRRTTWFLGFVRRVLVLKKHISKTRFDFVFTSKGGKATVRWVPYIQQNSVTFTFMLSCIVIDLFLNNQPDALIIQIYSAIKLYMFPASSLPIIRSFLLYIRHW